MSGILLTWSIAGVCQSRAPPDTRGKIDSDPLPDRPEAEIVRPDIVVVGRHGQVDTAIQPLATLDAGTIAATGATSIDELLRTIRGVTQSGDGQDPIFLLNAQRVSGY